MPSTEERIRRLVDENLKIEGRPLGRELDLGASLQDAGVSSLEFVAFAKLLAKEFDVKFSMDECGNINSVGELIEFLDAKAG